MDTNFRVVLTGGGSGGHIYPLIAVADALAKKAGELNFNEELIYIGPHDSYAPLFEARGIRIETITAGKLRRYASLDNFLDAPKFFIGFVQALWKLYRIMPDVIFSKGGTGALPVVVAGWFYRIPIAIHESDAIPGLTNSVSVRFARKVFLSFAEATEKMGGGKNSTAVASANAASAKVFVVGSPVRDELLDNHAKPELAKESLGFDGSRPLMLIIGGSQGARKINDFILTNLTAITAETQVLHQTGIANFLEAQELSHAALIDQAPTANRYLPVNYLTDNLATAYAAADVVVSRAGSGLIFEIAAFGKPAILIPITVDRGQQRANAYAFADTGAAVVIEEGNLLPGIFMNELKKILSSVSSADLRAKMSAASAKFFVTGAAETIAEEVLKMGA
jgi:UDP-N-acetylglucosamine--N-acetylmuramyl-(pentapeptide) pyrophosphoryl-undecaprenol N-acetylglucosamine transferase